jgi:hypothetical protein
MNRICQFVLGASLAAIVSAMAQTEPPFPVPSPPAVTNMPGPCPPAMKSPVVFFRKLLAMPAAEREAALKNRPPEVRQRILAKVTEYELLPPEERELRLRATELRWWLTPMLRMSPADQEKRLAQMPEELRELARSRLEQWRMLPPSVQEEFLANDKTLHYFAAVPAANSPADNARQQKITEQFSHFFELTADEKEKSLNKLSDAEREQMTETLKNFDKLPAPQREVCVRNYAIFASMSAEERAEFLKNAELWSKMTPEERQSWRDLVAQVPIWPEGWTPPNSTPPAQANFTPHHRLNTSHPSVTTN